MFEDFLSAMSKKDSFDLREPLDSFFTRTERFEHREDEYWHVSSLAGACLRRVFLELDSPRKVIPPSTRRIFGFGTALHSYYQNHWLGPAGILWGTWVWGNYEAVVKDSLMPEGPYVTGRDVLPQELFFAQKNKEINLREAWYFAKRKEGYWWYQEPEFVDEGLRLTGHCDGVLHFNKGRYLFELKTVRSDLFYREGLLPYESHIEQLQAYMGWFGISRGVLLYVNKNDSSERCFFVERDQAYLSSFKENLVTLNEAVDAKRLGKTPLELPKKRCVCTADATRLRCPFKKRCFG